MSFLSIQYLCFLGILFVIYYIFGAIKNNKQWVILLIASYVFYGFYSIKYMFFLVFSTLVTWGVSIGINECNLSEKLEILSKEMITKDEKKSIYGKYETKKKLWVLLAIVLNAGLLVVMKYVNFGIGIINGLTGWHIGTIGWVVLPLGFSFYTFQSLGYCIDVYRGVIDAQHNLFKYALFVSFFPQLCEGPIGTYDSLYPQLIKGHSFEYDRFVKGLIRILVGFFKKIVIADRLALFINPIYANYNDYSGIILCIATFMYSFQLYADFSGYIDIALGTGECLGIQLIENFETPYFATSISDFWRRWHISLGAWFRNYLYYPILRTKWVSEFGKKISKTGKIKLASSLTATFALVLTWTVIGMWHGAGYKYIAYGWYHGFFIILAVWLNGFYKKTKEFLHIKDNYPWKIFQIIRTFLIVTVGYVIFRAEKLTTALYIYKKIVSKFYYKGAFAGLTLLSRGEWIIILVGILFCFLEDLIESKRKISDWIYNRNIYVRWIIIYVLLALTLLFFLVRPADESNFIYFNF